MKHFRFILTLLALLLICSSAVLVSCDGNGEVTTEAPDLGTVEPTEAPEETTASPETTDEITEPAPETTEEVVTDPPHTHSFGAWNTVKVASCAEEGLTERACSCGEKETQPIAKTEHRVGEWIIDKEATSTEEGSKHQACIVCGTTVKTETIPVTPHIPGEWIIDKEATCTEAGSKHRVCTKCGETADTEVIPAKGHTEVIDPAKDATCTESGLTSGTHCSVCNAVITAQQTVAAKGHTEVADPAKAATCTENGLTAGSHCSACKAAIKAQQSVPAKGHSEKTVAAKAPTCTASGLTEGKTCTVCNATTVAQQTVPATGHKDGEWIIDKEATLTSTGSKHMVCSVCGATFKTETIPVLEPAKAEYTVTLLDGSGNPVANTKISFMSGATLVAEAVTDNNGKATVKLTEGTYEAVAEADGYASASAMLSVSAPSATLRLVGYASNPELVYPDEINGVYSVTVGSVRVPVAKDEMRYFFFAPAEGAVYKFYTDSDKVEVGYYGGSFYVSETNTGDIDANGVMTLTILHSQVGSTLVIGLKSTSSAVTECTLTIEKAMDIGISDAELPWDQYQLSKTPEKSADPKGSLHYVQITADISDIFNITGAVSEIQVYYNENDGFYHLSSVDGPVLYVKINSKTLFQEALITIANVTNVGCYFYDENGNFLKKESYNDAIIAYGAVADTANGVVPLDDELIYILKNIGAGSWYDILSPDSIFADDGVFVYDYNAWLFAVCYFS
ncbi:MAG: Ig-like domain-containing protein [Clostridia bacterium]|nr:Ig-like domain-containing protein [Clostridia bacterium]